MIDFNENAIEWITGSDTVTATFTQKKFINRVRRMSEKHAPSVKIVTENPDGSIVCKFPLKALHITIYGSNKGSYGRSDEDDG